MTWHRVVSVCVLMSAGRAVFAGASCPDLTALTIPGVTIQSAQVVAAGDLTLLGAQRPLAVGEFCRVVGVAAPSSDSDIKFEVWIPTHGSWNGKLLGTGNGGFSGAIGYSAMADALARGYATTGTDTGHVGDQMEFGRGHPEKIVDWAYRAVHVTSQAARLILRDFSGRFPAHSYFQGCSTGGQQALSEAQRFPEDYDGIIAGAPGYDRIRLIVGFLWSWKALHDANGEPLLTRTQLSQLTRAAVARCDGADGLKDGLIDDPRRCDFDPAALACGSGSSDSCLTQEQIAAVRKVYAGATNPHTGAQLFPGWARGSEAGWGTYLLDPKEPVRLGLFRDFVFGDPSWDWRTFDWDQDLRFVEAQVPYLSAVSPDLEGFRSRGGKLVMYTGWADPVVPPQDVVAYYETVARGIGGFRQTQAFFRFFAVPGMGHCGGGSGPNLFDPLATLEAWVEHGQAPERLTVKQVVEGNVTRTRALCPYPGVAAARKVKCVSASAQPR